jgi:hypothetical protein
MSAIRVTVEDLENGETGTRDVQPGDYCIVAHEPMYVDGVVKYSTGTVVLTLKLRKDDR